MAAIGFMVLVPAGVGVAMLAAVVLRVSRARRLAASGQRAKAVVVDNRQRSWSEGRLTFAPVVQFVTPSGAEVRTVLDDMEGNVSHVAGTVFEIVYDPARPEAALRATPTGGRVATTVVFGLLFLGFAAFVLCFFGPLLLGSSIIPGLDLTGFGDESGFGGESGFGDESGYWEGLSGLVHSTSGAGR
ncbi:hypothetical protein Acsp01_75220 [Actinoplanes sp. NBRC 101535]|nr:hypothetical protein Acsp01_75220 [Actinoplanes sp. NBRC 101535]